MNNPNLSISFVIPCLNEEEFLSDILEKIQKLCNTEFASRKTEIIVSDNGSTDNSIRIAQEHGVRVVNCVERGYGAALLFGIQNAVNDVVVFADADNTYDFLETPKLVSELEKGYDLVLGSRLEGNIHPGAMPFLHRHLGTPMLNFFINLLYSKGNNKVKDCNSGFRCFKRESFFSWQVKSKGMEFASEMLIKALKANAKISHVPISLYADSESRVPHLKRWRDGMRHLLQIFMDCPKFFFITGFALFLISWFVIIIGLFFGPISIGFASIFGLHSMMFGLLGSFFGILILSAGLFLSIKVESNIKIYKHLINLSEDKLFWSSVVLICISCLLFIAIIGYWAVQGFRFIAIEKETLVTVTFASNSMLMVFSIIMAHLLKKL
jgi:glycosyltransferase involved in cell wall biosynthesis